MLAATETHQVSDYRKYTPLKLFDDAELDMNVEGIRIYFSCARWYWKLTFWVLG